MHSGVCVAGGMHGRGSTWQGDMRGRGACMAGETATAADGMHPTGMHSCLHGHFLTWLKVFLFQNQSFLDSYLTTPML